MQTKHKEVKSFKRHKEKMANLGCHKVGGVTRRHEQTVLCSQLFGETKVADPDGLGVPALVHVEDVTGLQVSVNHLQTQQERSSQVLKFTDLHKTVPSKLHFKIFMQHPQV